MKYKSIIFDLDQTLIDSSALEALRASRQWRSVMQNLHLIKLHTETRTFLQELNRMNVKIGVITNSPRMYAEQVLKDNGIRYDCLVAYHDVVRRKPHPEAFHKALEQLQVRCEECISIGDQDNDILASRAANIPAIGVNWHTPAYQFTAQPDYRFSTPQQVLSHLKNTL